MYGRVVCLRSCSPEEDNKDKTNVARKDTGILPHTRCARTRLIPVLLRVDTCGKRDIINDPAVFHSRFHYNKSVSNIYLRTSEIQRHRLRVRCRCEYRVGRHAHGRPEISCANGISAPGEKEEFFMIYSRVRVRSYLRTRTRLNCILN